MPGWGVVSLRITVRNSIVHVDDESNGLCACSPRMNVKEDRTPAQEYLARTHRHRPEPLNPTAGLDLVQSSELDQIRIQAVSIAA